MQSSLDKFFFKKSPGTTSSSLAPKSPAPKSPAPAKKPEPKTASASKTKKPSEESPVQKKKVTKAAPSSAAKKKKIEASDNEDDDEVPIIKKRSLKRVVESDDEEGDGDFKMADAAPPSDDEAVDEEQDDTVAQSEKKKPRVAASAGLQAFEDGTVFLRDPKTHERCQKKLDEIRKKENENEALVDEGVKIFGSATPTSTKGGKLTPLEQQVVDMKKRYPGTVLFVEVGYKYRFFGEDAEIASRVLNIFARYDHNFLTASIPVHRLNVHMQKLVEFGYKVGVVSQKETANIKAAGANKSGPFLRELSGMYTKSTMLVDEADDPNTGSAAAHGGGQNYLMSIVESSAASAADSVSIAFVAVDTSCGDIVYDFFEDGPMRGNLETRITTLVPKEYILCEDATEATSAMIIRMGSPANGAARIQRISKLDKGKCTRKVQQMADEAKKSTASSTASASGGEGEGEGEGLLVSPMELNPLVICALGSLLSYLEDFNLHSTLSLTHNFWRFTSRNRMLIDANTMNNLELLKTSEGSKGSLFWLLQKTKTAFGSRLLKNWVTHPLIDIKRILDRQSAVAEIIKNPGCVEEIVKVLSSTPDLERALTRIHLQKCSPTELLSLLKGFQRVCNLFAVMKPRVGTLRSPLMQALISSAPDIEQRIDVFLLDLDAKAVAAGERRNMFQDSMKYPMITSCKERLMELEGELKDHLKDIRTILQSPEVQFTHMQSSKWLIEIPNKSKMHARVPDDWAEVNRTKDKARYHTPFVQDHVKQVGMNEEQLDIEVDRAWVAYQKDVASLYPMMRALVQRLAVFDVLQALAVVGGQSGWCRPDISEESELVIEGARHPMVEAVTGTAFVPNDTHLVGDLRSMIITGPNMGGKSSYIRQVALVVMLAQIGGYVPAEKVRMGVFDAVFTRMGASDCIGSGRSTFLVEMEETSQILKLATSRSLVILDELGRGTSTHDGVAIAHSTLAHLTTEIRCMVLFVTHYQLLSRMQSEFPNKVQNFHMSFIENESERGEAHQSNVTFLYKLVPGSAGRSYGLNVARLAHLPPEILQCASERSQGLEAVTNFCLGIDSATTTHSIPHIFSDIFSTKNESELAEHHRRCKLMFN